MSDRRPSKKRKREDGSAVQDIDTSKPTAVFTPTKGRQHTLSVALPGSIVANAQSHDLKTSLVGQIARALAVFCVDEVVIFDDGQGSSNKSTYHRQNDYSNDGYTGHSDSNHFMSHILSYLETPPHLRKHLFPLHPNLRTAGTLPSLDMPHHFRMGEWCEYREGVTVPAPNPNPNAKPSKSKNKKGKDGQDASDMTAHAEVGLSDTVILDTPLPPYTRVTVRLPKDQNSAHSGLLNGEAISPSAPREEAGYYWGFSVRPATSLSAVLTECPFEGGYDVTVGTSERGKSLSEIASSSETKEMFGGYSHLLLVFGGVAGLEVAVKADKELKAMDVNTPDKLFDCWVNLCPGQGSRTIRTEEAVWLGLMGLSGFVQERARK